METFSKDRWGSMIEKNTLFQNIHRNIISENLNYKLRQGIKEVLHNIIHTLDFDGVSFFIENKEYALSAKMVKKKLL